MNNIRVAAVSLSLLFFCAQNHGQTVPACSSINLDSNRPIALGLNSVWSSSSVNAVELGVQQVNAKIKLAITVCNASSQPIELDVFAMSRNLLATWETPSPNSRLSTRGLLSANGTNVIEIELLEDQAFGEPLLVLSRDGKSLATVFLQSVLTSETEKTRSFDATGLQSGWSDKWSPWYSVCLGERPLSYSIEPEKTVFRATGTAEHGRACGYWTQCRLRQNDDNDVCFEVTFQGHHRDPQLFVSEENDFVQGSAHLEAKYKLISTQPHLVPLLLNPPTVVHAQPGK